MSRPFYESDKDRHQENVTINNFADYCGVNFSKMKPSCIIDYALLKNKKVIGVVEVKNRNYSSKSIDNMGGLIISTSKIFSAKKWTEDVGVPFFLLVQLTDGVFYFKKNKGDQWPDLEIQIAGRKDRGDWQDMEPCCLFPMNLFTKIEIR